METSLKIITYNLRGVWIGDGINGFIHRAGMVLNKVDTEQPDVMCFQEVQESQANFLRRHLPDYELIYRGRETHMDGEGLAIALRRETMELMSIDCFWLSTTPNVPGSRFPHQSDCPRVCVAAMVRARGSHRPFWVYNNHLDHLDDEARVLGIRQVLERIRADQQRFALPVLILGDFNAFPDSEVIRFCDEYRPFPIVELTKDCGTTFHDFGKRPAYGQIDYIYADAATAARPHAITLWTDMLNGIYLSDHYPVCLTLSLGEPDMHAE